jgi:hypothetical protein
VLIAATRRPLADLSARRSAVAKPRVIVHPKCLSAALKAGLTRNFRSRKL